MAFPTTFAYRSPCPNNSDILLAATKACTSREVAQIGDVVEMVEVEFEAMGDTDDVQVLKMQVERLTHYLEERDEEILELRTSLNIERKVNAYRNHLKDLEVEKMKKALEEKVEEMLKVIELVNDSQRTSIVILSLLILGLSVLFVVKTYLKS